MTQETLFPTPLTEKTMVIYLYSRSQTLHQSTMYGDAWFCLKEAINSSPWV
jgi:hypothetical protein